MLIATSNSICQNGIDAESNDFSLKCDHAHSTHLEATRTAHGAPLAARLEHERGKRGDRRTSLVAAKATDSSSMTNMTSQPLLAPSRRPRQPAHTRKTGWLRTSLLGQLFSCQRTPRRPTSPSMRPDRPTPHAARPRRGHAWRPPPALPASLNAPAWPSQNAIAVSEGPPGATALSCSHPPQESTRMHRSTLGRT